MLSVTYSPKEIAAKAGCKVDKVLAWINSRELIAINYGSSQTGGKPRWRVTAEALEDFERARTTQPAAKPVPRRKRTDTPIKSYF